MAVVYLYGSLFFLFGLILGSFYNVVGYRLPQGKSIIKPPSHCPQCNVRLTKRELIPIFSYLKQKGHCKHCQTKINPSYLVFELVTGLLFVISYLLFGLSGECVIALILVSVLVISTISDLKYLVIPDEVLLGGGLAIFIGRLVMGYSFFNLLISAVIPFLVMLLIKIIGDFLFKQESLGGADIKLMLVFGLVLGWGSTVLAIFLAAFIALPFSLVILKKYKTNIIPFGPFLGAGALITYFQQIDISLFKDLLLGLLMI